MSHQQALDANDNITALAAAEGLDYHLERARPGNTFAAHRLLHLARDHGLQGEMKERLLRGYFSDGMAVGEVDGLVGAGVDIGLDKDEVLAVLETDAYADAVRADEAEASRLGISGVPFFVLDRRYGISGAQAPDTLLAGLDQAWKSRGPSPAGDPPAPVGGGQLARCDQPRRSGGRVTAPWAGRGPAHRWCCAGSRSCRRRWWRSGC